MVSTSCKNKNPPPPPPPNVDVWVPISSFGYWCHAGLTNPVTLTDAGQGTIEVTVSSIAPQSVWPSYHVRIKNTNPSVPHPHLNTVGGCVLIRVPEGEEFDVTLSFQLANATGTCDPQGQCYTYFTTRSGLGPISNAFACGSSSIPPFAISQFNNPFTIPCW